MYVYCRSVVVSFYANFQDVIILSIYFTQLNLSVVRGLHLCLASLALECVGTAVPCAGASGSSLLVLLYLVF